MQRRDFLRAVALGVSSPIALAGEGAAAPSPDELAAEALRRFIGEGRTCCESILMAGCDALGVESNLVPDIALGVAGGIGLRGHTCGVVVGVAMVLGVGLGPREADYAARKKAIIGAARSFCEEFEGRFGAADCRTLCGLDLGTAEGMQAFVERVKADVCAEYVEAGARMLAERLAPSGDAVGSAPA